MNRLQFFIEKSAFGVCQRIGELLGISTSTIRMYFIYASFLTLGSPIVAYLAVAFWMNVKKYLRRNTERIETIF